MNILDFGMGGFSKVGTWNNHCENKDDSFGKSLDEVLRGCNRLDV